MKKRDEIYSRTKVRMKSPKKTPEERAEANRRNAQKRIPNIYKAVDKEDVIPYVPSDEDMLADIYNPHNKYPPELKIQTATTFISTGGHVRKTAELMGITKQLVSDWKNNSEWWDPVIRKIQKQKQDELDALMTNVIDRVFHEVEDRVTNGDEVITKDGERIRKKMSGRELALTGAIMYDKRAMIRGEGQLGSKEKTASSLLADLKETFREVAKQELDKTVINQPKEDK